MWAPLCRHRSAGTASPYSIITPPTTLDDSKRVSFAKGDLAGDLCGRPSGCLHSKRPARTNTNIADGVRPAHIRTTERSYMHANSNWKGDSARLSRTLLNTLKCISAVSLQSLFGLSSVWRQSLRRSPVCLHQQNPYWRIFRKDSPQSQTAELAVPSAVPLQKERSSC